MTVSTQVSLCCWAPCASSRIPVGRRYRCVTGTVLAGCRCSQGLGVSSSRCHINHRVLAWPREPPPVCAWLSMADSPGACLWLVTAFPGVCPCQDAGGSLLCLPLVGRLSRRLPGTGSCRQSSPRGVDRSPRACPSAGCFGD